MEQEGNKDVYDRPQSEDEINKAQRLNDRQGNKAEQKIAVNPNPRANENIKDKEISTNENAKSSHTGSEITDGEDG
jgi:hypothetical protein